MSTSAACDQCQGNYAASVKETVPASLAWEFATALLVGRFPSLRTPKFPGEYLTRPHRDVIFFTRRGLLSLGGARGQAAGPEDRGSQTGSKPQPPSRAGGRPEVPLRRVLRSSGPGPGEVRDGSPGPGGGGPGLPDSEGVRVLPSHLLLRSGSLRRGRTSCPGPGEVRPPGSPQTHRGGNGLPRRHPGDASFSR